jgi:hypothetical protein
MVWTTKDGSRAWPYGLDLEDHQLRDIRLAMRIGPRNVSYALGRAPFSAEDVPLYTPVLDQLFAELDQVVLNSHRKSKDPDAHGKATMFRTGSIAAHRQQVDFYFRLAQSPAVRTICEVGFNAGHSTAVWLSANPTAHVYTFDLLANSFSAPAADLLRERFPGRFTVTKGNSLRVVPKFRLPPSTHCDLVHVDGKHSYQNTLLDFLNLVPKARTHALFVFDDQCDPRDCRATTVVPGEPTLATCDLVSTGLLERVVSFYEGPRQFALFRLNQTRAAGVRSRLLAGEPAKICGELCNITWTHAWHSRMWAGHLAKKLEEQQKRFRPRDAAESCA